MLRIRLRSGAAALALCAALGTSVVVSTSPAHATVVVPLTREQLVDWSDTVVRATVLSQQSLWNAQHTQIVTHSVLAVREYLKGSGPATLTLVTMARSPVPMMTAMAMEAVRKRAQLMSPATSPAAMRAPVVGLPVHGVDV